VGINFVILSIILMIELQAYRIHIYLQVGRLDAQIPQPRTHLLGIYSHILIHRPEHEDGLNDRPARKSALRAIAIAQK